MEFFWVGRGIVSNWNKKYRRIGCGFPSLQIKKLATTDALLRCPHPHSGRMTICKSLCTIGRVLSKVVRIALTNAASVAGVMLATETLVTDYKKDDKNEVYGAVL